MAMLSGQKLRAARVLRGISQSELAALAGVDAKAISQFETGKRELRTDIARKLCEALGVDVRYTLRDDGTEITGP